MAHFTSDTFLLYIRNMAKVIQKENKKHDAEI